MTLEISFNYHASIRSFLLLRIKRIGGTNAIPSPVIAKLKHLVAFSLFPSLSLSFSPFENRKFISPFREILSPSFAVVVRTTSKVAKDSFWPDDGKVIRTSANVFSTSKRSKRYWPGAEGMASCSTTWIKQITGEKRRAMFLRGSSKI